jgi:cysteinyl-tRNA synthetase
MEWVTRIFKKRKRTAMVPQIFLTNTLSANKEVFAPIKPGIVLLYSCGPTVYGPAHIGNLRAYVFSDTLARTLTAAGYDVHRVINITDVGHLVGDGDEGEDKMALGAKRDKTTPEAIAERYTKQFIDDLFDLNIDIKDIDFPHATRYIPEQIALAKTLEEKGFAYFIKNGLAFDTSRFPGYGKLGNIDLSAQKAGARIEMDKQKRNPADFWLWRTAKKGDLQQWNSPWGYGNPGWHVECSAMSRALLGPEIDIHTGGEDHIAVHHNNEIAQSEAASGRTFVRYWMHVSFLTVEGQKISKSLGNDIYLKDIAAKGYHPLSVRYFYLQAHYRTSLSFSWDALMGAAEALTRLWRLCREIAEESGKKSESSEPRVRFTALMRDDLSTAPALGILWETLKSEEFTPEEKWGLIEDAEAHLGLLLTNPPETTVAEADVPESVRDMLKKREEARAGKDYAEADRLREGVEKSGYLVEDGPSGPVLTKKAR